MTNPRIWAFWIPTTLMLLAAMALMTTAALPSAIGQDPRTPSNPTPNSPTNANPEDDPLALSANTEEAVRITLAAAKSRALAESLTLKRAGLQPTIEKASRSLTEAQFDWILSASTRYERKKDQSTTVVSFNPAQPSFLVSLDDHRQLWNNSVGISRYFDTGTRATATLAYNKSELDRSSRVSVNDSITFSLAFEQNLLKNFGVTANRHQYELADLNVKIKESALSQEKQTLLFNVEQAFWLLVLAHKDLDATASTTKLARQDLDIARRKRQAGLATEIDVVSAHARLKLKERELYERQKTVRDRSDELAQLIGPDWLLLLTTQPGQKRKVLLPENYETSDTGSEADLNLNDVLNTALLRREEVKQANLQKEAASKTVTYYEGQQDPDLKAVAGFSVGGGGPNTRLLFESFGRTDIVEWYLGLQLSVPLGNIEADANYKRSREQQTQAQHDWQLARVKVIAEVLAVIREIQTGIKTLEATKASEDLASKQVSAAQERLNRGLATRFEVESFKNQYDLAKRDTLTAEYTLKIARSKLRRTMGTME